jgi:hypothetical protein
VVFVLRVACVSILFLGLAPGPVVTPAFAQTSTSRSVVEEPTLDGGSRVLSEVETSTTEIATGTSQTTRREYGTDANGRSTLLQSVEEHRTTRPDGGESVVREFTHPDVNGRAQAIRRETRETVAEGGGVYRTEIEVSVPGASGDGFIPTERVEQTERRDGDRLLESESITYTNVTNRGEWRASEQRVVQQSHGESDVQSVESVYRPDGSGRMVLRDQIVRKEWTGSTGQQHSREEIHATEIPGQGRSTKPRLFQQIDTVRTARSGGGSQTTREVRETRGNRRVVVERTIERERPDGRGGIVVEREVQRRDVNGRLRTVAVAETAGP